MSDRATRLAPPQALRGPILMTGGVIFHNDMEMTMTNDHFFNLACTIEELRLEAKEAPTTAERLEIEAELAALRAELAAHAEAELP